MKRKSLRICLALLAAYLLLGAAFYWIAGDSLHFTQNTTEGVASTGVLSLFTTGNVLEQHFTCPFDELQGLSVLVGTMSRINRSQIQVELLDAETREPIIAPFEISTEGMRDNAYHPISLPTPIKNAQGKAYILRLIGQNGTQENAVAFYYGTAPAHQDKMPLLINGEAKASANGETCTLCLKISGKNLHWLGPYYWWIWGGGALLLALVLAVLLRRRASGKSSVILRIGDSLLRYGFLIRQLVARDFKTKYKRSFLGMVWSFLNPLLTMSIQYVVFSTLFRSDIDNFVIYLLGGIVCFNFFNEATAMCLMSIVGNAQLINKVSVPKYIYPFSRTLSSTVNLALSLAPLFLMMIFTKTPIRISALLLPFPLLMLFAVSYGVGLILSSMMVFFRDTQFLWSILSLLLMYLTPVFYPESIIPSALMPIYKLNPLYHVLRFVRILLISGISPEPKAYLYCFVLCTIPLLVGVLIFRKTQDKFIFHI